MKKIMILIIAVSFILSLGGNAFATEKGVAPVVKMKHITGYVKSVDVDGGNITVAKKNKDIVVTVDEKTKIIIGKEQKTLLDVKVGDRVGVNYTDVDGNKIAKMVSINYAKRAALEKQTQ